MPFYEYECANCKFYKEVMQKVSDAPLKKCPSCGKNALKKLVSAPVFRLKGAGWYETDFKSDNEHKRNLAEKEPEPEKKKEPADSKDAAGEARKAMAKATSSGWPQRCMGTFARSASYLSGSAVCICRVMPVAIGPGHTALTRIPLVA